MGSGLDFVWITDSDTVRDGLKDMLTAAIGEHAHDLGHVEPGLALLLVEIARRADDRIDWFPRGKWATIQAIQAQIDRVLQDLFSDAAISRSQSHDWGCGSRCCTSARRAHV